MKLLILLKTILILHKKLADLLCDEPAYLFDEQSYQLVFGGENEQRK